MKLRYIIAIYSLLLLVFFAYSFNYNNCLKDTKVNMPDLNAHVKSVEAELLKGSSIESIEEKYDCNIIFKNESTYRTELNNAISYNKIIFDYENKDNIIGKIVFENDLQAVEKKVDSQNRKLIIFFTFFSIIGYLLIFCIYFSFIRPFKTLKNFSSNIAKGNFDFPLPMKKGNYFGSFTESFDIMREELIKARENEQRANQSKKELVAELSHDMKTPIATIKANCEVSKAKLQKQIAETPDCYKNDQLYDDFNSKICIIEQKADMIDQLISNMFHASLYELNNLQVEPKEEPSTLIKKDFDDLNYYKKIRFKNDIPECLVLMDELRFNQVIDNIINNSYKYANTDIDISFMLEEKKLSIEIRDYGPGVPENEISLITEKFFRGSNKSGKNGSGLGLYLASYFMENMNGGLECFNDNGFVVRLFLNKI